MTIAPISALPRFVLLFAAMYAAFGASSPFLPAFVNSRGLPAEQIGLVLGVGTAGPAAICIPEVVHERPERDSPAPARAFLALLRLARVLWSLSVAAEVLVFLIVGPALVKRLTPAGAMALASLAGVLRWTVEAQTTHVVALALVQPLHGITFALLHLSCMDIIARVVPRGLEGTAQTPSG